MTHRINLTAAALFIANIAAAQFVYDNPTTPSLGSSDGSYKMQTSFTDLSGDGAGQNRLMIRQWYSRSGTGNTWLTTHIVDGISVDGSFLTPATARTFWKREPLAQTQSWGSDGLAYMTLKPAGLGIGTTNIGSDKLAVNGTIHAKEVRVDMSGWSDYVFSPGYKLPPLPEVERYIKQHRHLSEIPSAKEVEENGVKLGEMNALLLRKIEELTLYVIDQQKKMEGMQLQIDDLKKAGK